MQQTTNTILMICPIHFRMNEQTMVNNFYQKELLNLLPNSITKKAQKEFDTLVNLLKKNGVNVIVVHDTEETDTPDALFPNNWISFHQNGNVGIYPMFAENRRLERRYDILDIIESEGFIINNIIDYSEAEEEGFYLEGTGSAVLDRKNSKAYCALSDRSDEELFIEFCEDFEFTPVIFTANQTVNGQRKAMYHTNVLMNIGETFAVICLDAIDDKKERKNVVKHLKSDGKEIIAITEKQVQAFAGNVLQVLGKNNEPLLVMSTSAYNSFTKIQLTTLLKHNQIIHSSLETIETCGGGSARCMMAEVFLPTSKG